MNCTVFKVLALFMLVTIHPVAKAQEPEKRDPVPLPGSELRQIHSDIMDQNFRVYIQLPLNYDPKRNIKYPVMFVTDGNRSFPMVANISTVLGFPDTGFPQVIVVGIAYDIGQMEDWAVWRTRDLTPTPNRDSEIYWEKLIGSLTGDTTIRVKSGGASRFLEFISDELIPYIESEYPVLPGDRGLGGYSYGGLFTLFALFEKPGLFQRYFAGSPSIHYDNEVMFRIEENYSVAHTDLEARLFLCAGQLEGEGVISRLHRLSGKLEFREYPGLELNTHIFEGENHLSAYPASIMRAFTWLYSK